MFKDNLSINYVLRHQPRSQDLPDIAALNWRDVTAFPIYWESIYKITDSMKEKEN